MPSMSREIMLNEIRYAERLCQRTARLYRRIQSGGTFLAVLGGSGALSALSPMASPWVAVVGAAALATAGAALVAIRPADKAAANEADAKRYAALRVKAATLDDACLRTALDEARTSDTAEIESLRDVAYNDVVLEVGQPTYKVPLAAHQRILAALA